MMRAFILFVALMASTFTAVATEKTLVLSIPAMHCKLCSTMIQKTLNKTDGVQNIIISEENKTVEIIFDNQKTSIEQLIKIIADIGYPSVVIETKKEN